MTKRQLGLLFVGLGLVGILGSFLIDLVSAGGFQGIGPTQKWGLVAAGAIISVGLTLIPFGDKPA